MKIRQFEIPGLSQYSYLVSSGSDGIVIDPMRDFDRYLNYAAEQDLTIRYVTETHIHADFASGAHSLAKAAGAELVLSGHDQGERYSYSMNHKRLHDGDELQVGQARLKALHTPGHTPEHLSFVLFDDERNSSEPLALFSGDFLFVGSFGRPDLLGESEKQRLAHELYRSLHERVRTLPDSVTVYPGHGAGSLCGSGMSIRPESSLGYERATQPLFGLNEDAFVREVLASVPAMPSYYPRMKGLNAEGAVDFRAVPPLRLTSPQELSSRLKEGEIILLDIRRPEAFGGAHIPGALNIGAGQNLSLWAGWMLDPETPIFLVSETEEVAEARLSLLRVGLDKVEGQIKKGMPAWIDAGLPIARIPQLSTQEVQGRAEDAVVIDVRSDQEWTAGRISKAKHIMLGDLPQHLSELAKDGPLITVCGTGYRSSIAASLLQREGFTNVSSMAGGMTAWNAQELPSEKT